MTILEPRYCTPLMETMSMDQMVRACAQCVSFTNALVKESPSVGILGPNITKMMHLLSVAEGKQNKTIIAKFIFDCVLIGAKTMDPKIESHCMLRTTILNKISDFSLEDTSFLDYERLFRRRTAKFGPDNVPPQ